MHKIFVNEILYVESWKDYVRLYFTSSKYLLVKQPAEYALRGITKPIGVSEYELTEKIPAALKGKLPTIKQIKKELKNINS